ncbi:MAG: hypothetical protein WCK29_04480, partial [archaeon]
LNNNIYNNNIKDIVDSSSGTNNLVYNNSYGQITWTGALLNDMSMKGNLAVGSGIILANNNVGINLSQFSSGNINSSAEVTINSVNAYVPGTYSDDNWYGIAEDGLRCSDCSNTGSLEGNVAINVAALNGVYSIGLAPHSKSEIPLNAGWNMFSLTLNDTVAGNSTVEIPVVAGWNLVGFSGNSSVDHSSLKFTPEGETVNETWRNATASQDVSFGLAYYNSTGTRARYQYAPYDDSKLRSEFGYWIYAQQAGTVKISGVNTASDNTGNYAYSSIMIRNDNTGEVKTIGDAATAGWINRYIKVPTSGGDHPVFNDICDDEFSCVATSLSSWDGYFIYSFRSNITLLRQD